MLMLNEVIALTQSEIGKRIASLRTQMGITQMELALRCGVEQSYIAALEQGAKRPSFSSLEKLSGAFEMSMKDFLSFGEAEFCYEKSVNKALSYLLAMDDTAREKATDILRILLELSKA